MSVLEVADGPRLDLPAEPLDLKVALRRAMLGVEEPLGELSGGASGGPSAVSPGVPAAVADATCLGVWLWSRWQPALEPRGCTREQCIDTVAGLRREVVLWLLGDRVWHQLVSSLAGRVSRRLPPLVDGPG